MGWEVAGVGHGVGVAGVDRTLKTEEQQNEENTQTP